MPSPDRLGDPIRILVVEGEGQPPSRLRALLGELGPDRYSVEWADSFEAGQARISGGGLDIYLIDQERSTGAAVELVSRVRASDRTTPVIVFAVDPTPEADLELMQGGADDLLIKGRTDATLLDRSIRYAVERRRRLEQQLLDGERLEALGTIAGAIAHNFNNLLTVVLGNAALLSRSPPAESATQRLLDEIQQAAHHGAALTREMLVYADRNRAGRFHRLDLSALIEDMRELLEVAVGGRGLLSLDLARTGGWLVGDPSQLRHLLIELANNAGEAMDSERASQGAVSIRTRMLSAREVESPLGRRDAREATERVLLEISDDGAGMDVATRQRAFDPFFTTKSLGRGLGLSAAFGIAHAHGGTIDIRSAPGSGTTIRIVLPAAASAAAPASGD